jgi:hypothetical protein
MIRYRLTWVLLALLGCGGDEVRVLFEFPNPDARAALRRLQVRVYPGADALRTCQDGFLGTAARGEAPVELPNEFVDQRCADDDNTPCAPDWFESVTLEGVRAGRGILYVRGFAGVGPNEPVVFEGCSDDFDTGDGDQVVGLAFVLPDSARSELLAPPSRVGLVGEVLALPVRVVAQDPASAGARNEYALPGYEVRVMAGDAPVALDATSARTNVEGVVDLAVELQGPGQGTLRIQASGLEPTEVRLTAVEPLAALRSEMLARFDATPVDLAVGDADGDGPDDVAVALCGSEGRCRIDELTSVDTVAGVSGLAIVEDRTRVQAVVADGWGRLPVDVEWIDLPGEPARLGVLSARTADCRPSACPDGELCRCVDGAGRPCGCESSSLVLLAPEAGSFAPVARYVTSASTAVAFRPLGGDGDPNRFAIVTRGRVDDRQSCVDNCDCARGDRCDVSVGRCEDLDQPIEMVIRAPDRPDTLYDPVRCACADASQPTFAQCESPPPVRCGIDVQSRISLAGPDDLCGRPLLPVVPAGAPLTTTTPQSMAILDQGTPSFVVGGVSQVGFISGSGWRYSHQVSRRLHERFDGIALAQLDPNLEPEVVGGGEDLVFWGRGACERFVDGCPVVAADGARGCVGVLATAGVGSLLDVDERSFATCRRFDLDFVPVGGCVSDVDGDGALDLALTAEDDGGVRVLRGDGFGGWSATPEVVTTAAEGGGPMACQDGELLFVSPADRSLYGVFAEE